MLTAKILARLPWFGHLVAVLMVAVALGACADRQTGGGQSGSRLFVLMPVSAPLTARRIVEPTTQPTIRPTGKLTSLPASQPTVLSLLVEPGLDLRAGPVDIPLELWIPSLQISAPMLGVGITPQNVMDAPKGLAGDPVWQQVFWYRGSGVPGEVGTATLAGHVDDASGRPAVFARLGHLRAGDTIVVRDTRSGLDVGFTVVETVIYSAQEATDPANLARIYGSGPVSGLGPQPAADGLAHLTLITCTGSYANGSYGHRLVVYATRSDAK